MNDILFIKVHSFKEGLEKPINLQILRYYLNKKLSDSAQNHKNLGKRFNNHFFLKV